MVVAKYFTSREIKSKAPICWQESILENLATYYDNTISDSFFNLNEHDSLLSDKERSDFLQVVSSSINLQDLGKMALQQLRARLNVKSIQIVTALENFAFGQKVDEDYQKQFKLQWDQDPDASIVYSFTRTLSIRENQLLKDFHQCLKNPFRNALSFFQVQKLALKDGLTALGNRRQYDETIHKLISQAHRSGDDLSLIVIDLDKFKPVNDRCGHHEGDKVLIAVAGAIKSCLRESDYAFRFGGDEFCFITQNSKKEINEKIVKRVQAAIANDPILQRHGITCSFGGSMLQPKDDVSTLFTRADENLYQAKNAGRDQFVIE